MTEDEFASFSLFLLFLRRKITNTNRWANRRNSSSILYIFRQLHFTKFNTISNDHCYCSTIIRKWWKVVKRLEQEKTSPNYSMYHRLPQHALQKNLLQKQNKQGSCAEIWLTLFKKKIFEKMPLISIELAGEHHQGAGGDKDDPMNDDAAGLQLVSPGDIITR